MKELSPKNPYYLPKYRYLEIKNFAMQYEYWKEEVQAIDILGSVKYERIDGCDKDPVWAAYKKRELYLSYIDMVEEAAELTDDILGYYCFLTATKACTYDNLRLLHNIPCCRSIYYDNLRRYYYILSGIRK